MDPLTLVFSAIVAGAAAAMKPTAERAITDGYKGLKALISAKWKRVVVDAVERDPGSAEVQETLKKDLQAEGKLDDRELLQQAQVVLKAVRAHDPVAATTAGISITDLDIAGTATIEDLVASGRVTVRRIKTGGDFNLKGVKAGNPRER